ncbi:MAG TPA: lipase family protein, partial [Beutenbergiaceae bacterium]|nr:lipase family protein [Beutenbergiaceae bacterium]
MLTLAGVGAVMWVEKTYIVLAYLPSIALLAYGLVTLGRNAASLPPITGFGRPLIWGPSAVLVAFAIWPFPDVVLMALALASAVAVACVGIATVRGAPWRVRPRTRRLAVVGALPAAVVLVIASGAASTHPSPDDFYDPDTELGADTTPGSLISQDAAPAPRGAVAKRIVYSTTHHTSDSPVLASGTVYVPRGATNPPVVAWAHGTTGQTRGCAPSVIGQEAGGMMVLDDLLQAGWAVMAADYAGLATPETHPYLIGADQARNVIDGVKAASSTGLGVGEQTVLWGYSQGGHAALWAGQMWADYAPEHTLAGVVAFAPAA